MIEQFIRGRIGVLIDDSNLFHSQRTMGWKVDYRRLLEYLRSHSSPNIVVRIYTPIQPGDARQHNFTQKLERIGYSVVKKEIKIIQTAQGRLVKGNLDIELALDAYRHSDEYDNLVLFSGDSDFAYLLDILKEKGKTSIVISSRKHISRELIERSKFVILNRLRKYIERSPIPLENPL